MLTTKDHQYARRPEGSNTKVHLHPSLSLTLLTVELSSRSNWAFFPNFCCMSLRLCFRISLGVRGSTVWALLKYPIFSPDRDNMRLLPRPSLTWSSLLVTISNRLCLEVALDRGRSDERLLCTGEDKSPVPPAAEFVNMEVITPSWLCTMLLLPPVWYTLAPVGTRGPLAVTAVPGVHVSCDGPESGAWSSPWFPPPGVISSSSSSSVWSPRTEQGVYLTTLPPSPVCLRTSTALMPAAVPGDSVSVPRRTDTGGDTQSVCSTVWSRPALRQVFTYTSQYRRSRRLRKLLLCDSLGGAGSHSLGSGSGGGCWRGRLDECGGMWVVAERRAAAAWDALWRRCWMLW